MCFGGDDVEMENNDFIMPCFKEELDEVVEEQDVIDSSDEDIGSSTLSSSKETSSNDVDLEESYCDFDPLICGHIEQKLKNWVVRNIQTLTQTSIDEMLMVLRSEGYTSLPKSCKTLLGTSTLRGESKVMRGLDDTLGKFQYFGIKSNLDVIIDPNLYKEKEIKIIVHVDGMDVFEKSKNNFWSIMGKVFSPAYITKPFLIALYYGNSKPHSAREFLKDLVSEANFLTNEGINNYFS